MENVEPQFEKNAQSEVGDRASRKLVRESLMAAGLDRFENELDAVDGFLNNLDLTDPTIAFGKAAEALNAAERAFGMIDRNHDERLSHPEIAEYANRLEGDSKQLAEWVLAHFEALQNAGFGHAENGISRSELQEAAAVFGGLDYVHNNFASIAGEHDGVRALSHADINTFLDTRGGAISESQRRGLTELTFYLRRLEQQKPAAALSKREVDQLTPEQLFESDH